MAALDASTPHLNAQQARVEVLEEKGVRADHKLEGEVVHGLSARKDTRGLGLVLKEVHAEEGGRIEVSPEGSAGELGAMQVKLEEVLALGRRGESSDSR